jgi:tetratricopeptide (TPR) repeat protein
MKKVNLDDLVIKLLLHINQPKLLIRYTEKVNNKSKYCYYALSDTYYKLGNYSKHIAYLMSANEAYPNDFYTNYALGEFYYVLGFADKAKPLLEKALLIERDAKTFQNSLIHSLLGTCYFDLGQFDLAENEYDKSCEMVPYNFDAIVNRSILFQETNRFDNILPYFETILNNFPDFYPIYRIIGSFYKDYLFDVEKSIYYFDKAMELSRNPNALKKYKTYFNNNFSQLDLNISNSFMYALIQLGRASDALKLITNSYKIRADKYNEYEINLLGYYSGLDDWDKGYKEVLRIKKRNKNDIFLITCLLFDFEMRVGNPCEVIKKFSEYYKQTYPMPFTCEWYANSLIYIKDYINAKEIYRDLVNRYPWDDTFRNPYAYCLLQLGEFQKAIPEYQKLTMHDPYNGEIELALGICLYEMGEKEKGITAIQNANMNKKFYKPDEYIIKRSKEIISHN